MFLLASADKAINTLPEWQVIVIGMGVVFVGLICIVLLCMAMSAVYRAFVGRSSSAPAAAAAPVAAPVAEEIPNRQQVIAAVSAVIAEEMGADVSKLRILSIKKI